jgi:hypothetical protein
MRDANFIGVVGKSAAERRWAELNRAVEWEGKEDANL